MMFRVPEPPPKAADWPASVARDLLGLLNRKLRFIALIDQCRRHACDAAALSELDRLRQGEVDDVAILMDLRGGAEARAVRQWLADAWRHGEVVDDEDGRQLERAGRAVDRFAVVAAAAPLAVPPEEPVH